jgi:hypothetical protein
VSADRGRRVAIALTTAVVAPLLLLQWRMIAAHHDRRFSWEETVPFDQRVRVASGYSVPGYTVVGNPFAFPANVAFALRHRVPLARYDRAVGPYLLDERVSTTNPLLPSKRSETVRLSEPWAIALFGRGMEQTVSGANLAGVVGELFVPLNRPGSLVLDVATEAAGAPEATWAFNGHQLTAPPFQIDAAWVERGINVLRVETSGGLVIRELTLTEGPDWPPPWTTDLMGSRR